MTCTRRKKLIRQDVAIRDGLFCCFCRKELSFRTLTMEHIVPESKQGSFNRTNLTISCKRCNNHRGDKNFFEYLENFSVPEEVYTKYIKLFNLNIKVKVLNVAKETCIKNDYEIPCDLIRQACEKLDIKSIDLSDIERYFEMALDIPQSRKKIKFHFENVIRLIESL